MLLLSALLEVAAEQGIRSVSLSIEPDNPALNLYQSFGFKPIKMVDDSWIMVAAVNPPQGSN
jgi:ribosomal protein S18 acetylase RimI-like enzyme